jgi:hypothetical protein
MGGATSLALLPSLWVLHDGGSHVSSLVTISLGSAGWGWDARVCAGRRRNLHKKDNIISLYLYISHIDPGAPENKQEENNYAHESWTSKLCRNLCYHFCDLLFSFFGFI